MKSFVGLTVSLCAIFAAVLAVEALFAWWWDLADEDSLLPFFAAAGIIALPLLAVRRGKPRPFAPGEKWAADHIVASAAVLAACAFLFVLVWGVLIDEAWSTKSQLVDGGSSRPVLGTPRSGVRRALDSAPRG